jgi:superfamily I DNA/RNA helicase/PHP family Zn ribbon phosphoesterase
MSFIADLHIHSRFSRATSSRLNPASLDRWARIKGIDILGTGDCTHPVWLAELRDQLEEAEEGFYRLKEKVRTAFDRGPGLTGELPRPAAGFTRFMLTGEISTIYKREGKTRKVHHLIILPNFKAAAAFSARLERAGNIRSDGRPILGIDSRVLLSMLLESVEEALLIPAHIWTPWFSVLGAKSGFDSIEECYGDLSSHIPAVETGLSSNPSMNWALSRLDRFSIISNSDAHSLDKLGREATILEMDLSFPSFKKALGSAGGSPGPEIRGTIEFFPQEGKYHYAGHRDCGVCLDPEEATRWQGRCPVCGKLLTEGVMGRVLELADRPVDERPTDENSPYPPGCGEGDRGKGRHGEDGHGKDSRGEGNRRPYYSLVPLKEILGEILCTGSNTRRVQALYGGLIEKGGSEFSLLMDMSPRELAGLRAPGLSGELLAEGISRMRDGKVSVSPGYDGEYGVIRVFPVGKAGGDSAGPGLFGESPEELPKEPTKENAAEGPTGLRGKTRSRKKNLVPPGLPEKPAVPVVQAAPGEAPVEAAEKSAAFTLNQEQERAAACEDSRVLVIAGPGTGKTALLAARIARLLAGGADPASILALSFTVKAAAELRERILRTAGAERTAGLTVATFHSLCSAILREQGIPRDFRILDEERRDILLREICAAADGSGKNRRPRQLGAYIEERKRFLLLPGETEPKLGDLGSPAGSIPAAVPELEALYRDYRNRIRVKGLLDFEDLPAGLVRLLLARGDLLEQYRNRYRHIFVDEYQDINFAQYVLIRLLAPPAEDTGGTDTGQRDTGKRTLWLIGDPNQAIYGFRGSDKRFIDRFLDDYPGAGRFELTRSFRCAAPIIGAAGHLVGTELQGRSGLLRRDGGAVSLYRSECDTDRAEAEGIARTIAALVGGTGFFAIDSGVANGVGIADGTAGEAGATGGAGNVAPEDCAVLLRAAILSGPVIKALKDHGIPFELNGEQVWWEEEPVSGLLDRLRENQGNRKNPESRRGPKDRDDQTDQAGGEGWRPPGLGPGSSPADSLGPEEEIRETWEALNRQKGRTRHGKDAPEPVERLIRLAALFGNLQSLLDTLVCSDADEVPGERHREGVKIMTIHASKGLEFDHVFVPGLEEGILPFTLYNDSAGEIPADPAASLPIEEERRILYVAMTRARQGLYLSWARSRVFRGRVLSGSPSRFLGELEQLVPQAEEERRVKRDPQLRLF